jgi:hypothetical protein
MASKGQIIPSSHYIPPAGLLGESQIFAVNKKMSVARQSAGTLKTKYYQKENNTCHVEPRTLVVQITAFSFRKTSARLSTTCQSTSQVSAWRGSTSSAAQSQAK